MPEKTLIADSKFINAIKTLQNSDLLVKFLKKQHAGK
tara:strand:- start:3392 stop:3502 length:111 start_codon:yes stop_codon:yes gene_type:complete